MRTVFLLSVLCVLLSSNFANAQYSGEDTGLQEACCTHGQTQALSASSAASCEGLPLPDDEDIQGQEDICRAAVVGCCREHFKNKDECGLGMKHAVEKRCDIPKTEIGRTCCEECSFGRWTGESQGEGGCLDAGNDDTSPSLALRSFAYHQCCLEAAKEQITTTTETAETTTEIPETTTEKRTTSTSTTTKKPERDLCRSGSCEQICNDDSGAVRCQCHDGYRLQSDNKSCKDINECKEALDDVCTEENEVCHNTVGSFRCVPLKKRDVGITCPPGFKRNVMNQVCDDINECQLPRPPCPKYLCENTIGGYKCAGKPGKPFEESPPGAPTLPAAPEMEPPKNDICPQGFRAGPDDECLDVDECEDHTDDCQRLSQYCINTNGGFFCQDHVSKRCAPGFKVNVSTGICEDIDECVESVDVCQRNQICINLAGAYNCKSKISTLPKLATKTCQEGTRLRPGVSICEDIDECREGTHLCDQFQNCVNTYGGHECRCKNGFELDSSSGSCVDVDECALKLDNCAPGLHCINVLGSYSCTRRAPTSAPAPTTSTTHTPVYEYEYYDSEDEDEKSATEIIYEVTTSTTTAKPTTPIPETPPPTPPLPPYPSYNRPRVTTTRRTPIRPNRPRPRPTTTSTTTEEPTTLEVSTLPEDRYSGRPADNNVPETPNRREPRPYAGYPGRPDDNSVLEETTRDRRPPRPSYPGPPASNNRPNETTPDRREPRPYSGYPEQPDNNSVPERTTPDRRPEYVPRPTDPPRRPRPNYPPRTNEPPREYPTEVTVDKPTEKPAVVETDKERDGSYGLNTSDIPKNQWTNVVGRDKPEETDFDINNIHCLNGFERDAQGNCVDIDECQGNRHICSTLESCTNMEGGYRCDCIAGFQRDPTGWCVPVRHTPPPPPTRPTTRPTPRTTTSTTTERTTTEVMTTPTWRHSTPSRPRRPYAPRTSCELGYTFDSSLGRCVDIDECARNDHICAPKEDCINQEGGYYCMCGSRCRTTTERPTTPPYEPASAPAEPFQPSRHDPYRPSSREGPYQPREDSGDSNIITVGAQYGQRGPRYLRPSFTRLPDSGAVVTSCLWGYKLTPDKMCYDIDECAKNVSQCGPQQRCENFFGGYSCQCPTGHKLYGKDGCEDIDECKYGTPCPYNAKCINTVGSYRCECGDGFRNSPSNDKVCVDIDECTETPQVCHQSCSNAWGSYRCYCKKGYRLSSDNRTCEDVDECAEWASVRLRGRLCGGACHNQPGSYRCGCPAGYRLADDGKTCIDIDECETGEATCASSRDPGNVCQNTRGGYHCHHIDCPSGYRLEGKHRCSRVQRTCPLSDWGCLQRPSAYSYSFITFVANVYLPSGSVDLFTMHGPSWRDSVVSFELRMIGVQAGSGVKPADLRCFDMRPMDNVCVISLLCSLGGPQVAELELTMSLYQRGQFAGNAVARLIIIVSQYEF